MRRTLILLSLFAASAMPVNISAQSVADIRSAENGLTTEQSRDAKWYLTQHQRLAADISALQPQTNGVIDAFVVAVGMDADPVFARELKEAASVLSRRFGANGRVILLASGDNSLAAQGSPVNIATALAAVAAKMDLNEDVLVLYTTSHGSAKTGVVYQDGQNSFGMVSPSRLANLINGLGIKRRLIIVSACYSGVFIPPLASDDTIIITAASERRTSFGCNPGNDWTFFGDALINHALRAPVSFEQATKNAKKQIFDWENQLGLISSEPQVSIGTKSAVWLSALEANISNTISVPIGRPAISGDAKAASK
jgi:Peptidase C13 family